MRLISTRMAVLFFIAFSLRTGSLAADVSVHESAFSSTPEGFAFSDWSVRSSLGISSMSAVLSAFGDIKQINPGGALTVFPDILSGSDRNNDSHFLFDTTSATIISQSEDNSSVAVKVAFNANYPTSFTLGHVVFPGGSAFSGASITGTLVDGSPFSLSAAIVPEPSVNALLLFGAAACWLGRGRFGSLGGGSSERRERKRFGMPHWLTR
jgi:hypothetical protein